MKKALVIILIHFLVNSAFSQSPPGIPYQAEVRNESGEVLVNTNVNVRFTLHEQAANGTVSFQETHALTTNELGLFAVTIGAGTAVQGTFAAINWAQTTKFLQVEVDAGNGWITMGNQQLMSVPYALYAANSQPGPQGPQGPQGPAGENIQTTLNFTAGYGIEINGDTISALHSIQNLFSGGAPQSRIGISSTTNWTCPSGVTQILVEVWGAGGGGGAGVSRCIGFNGCGAGFGGNGGSGGYNRSVISVIPGQVYQITIGSGGSGGLGNCPPPENGSPYSCSYGPYCGLNDGGDGGNTSFNGLVTANGGTGGKKACIQRLCSGWISSTNNGENGAIMNYPSNPIPHFINQTYMSGYSVPGCCTSGGQGGSGGCPHDGGNGETGYCIISY
jgi:hypothetical protein